MAENLLTEKVVSVFFCLLPCYRSYSDGTLYGVGDCGDYWSRTQSDHYSDGAYYLDFRDSDYASWHDWGYYYVWYNKSFGFSVRPVAE